MGHLMGKDRICLLILTTLLCCMIVATSKAERTKPLKPLTREGTSAEKLEFFDIYKFENYDSYDAFTSTKKLPGVIDMPFALIKTRHAESGNIGIFASDGTDEGTHFLFDTEKGSKNAGTAVYHKGKAYFSAGQGELWSTDGTPANTKLVKDIFADDDDTTFYDYDLDELLVFQNAIYFIANEEQLWRSDGTEQGTFMVEKFDGGGVRGLSNANDEYLLISIPGNKVVLKNDGKSLSKLLTSEATNPVLNPRGFVPFVNDRSLFRSDEGIWSTRGEEDSTELFFNMTGSGDGVRIFYGSIDNRRAFFAVEGEFLFYTDGTERGTRALNLPTETPGVLEKNFEEETGIDKFSLGVISAFNGSISYLPSFEDKQGFVVFGNDDSIKFWKTDGSQSGTEVFKSFDEFTTVKTFGYYLEDGRLVFRSNEEIYITDGSKEGTKTLVKFDDPPEDYAYYSGVLVGLEGNVLIVDHVDYEGTVTFWRINIPGKNKNHLATILPATLVPLFVLSLLGVAICIRCRSAKSNNNAKNNEEEKEEVQESENLVNDEEKMEDGNVNEK